MPNIKHKKVSALADGADAALVQPSNWNDEHTLDQYLDYPTLASTPATPAASPGDLRVFARSRGGRRMLSMVGPSGVDTALQPSLYSNAAAFWTPGTGNVAAISFGTSWTVGATQAHPTIAATNFHSAMRRATFTTTNTAGNTAGVRAAAACCLRGSLAKVGGFFFFARFGFTTISGTFQFFVGLSANAAALAGEPSAQANSVGIGKDAADTNLQLIFRDGAAATKVNLGVAPVVDQVYDVILFCPPNGSNITAYVQRLNDDTVQANNTVHTANLPVNTALLLPRADVRNGTTAAIAAISLARIYLETDN